MKKYIDQINELMDQRFFFRNTDLEAGIARADALRHDAQGGEILRRKLLIGQQLKKNALKFGIIRKPSEAHIETLIRKMKNEIFSEFKKNPFAEVTLDSLCEFMKTSAMKSEKITAESYINWFIEEMALVEEFVDVDTEILKEFAPEDVESTIKYLRNDIVIEKLSEEEMAHIALATLTNNITDVTLPELKSLLKHMFIESEGVEPIDFIVTIVEDRLGKDFNAEYLPMFLVNQNLECSSIEDVKSIIIELSDAIAGIEEDKDGGDSGLASSSGASSPELSSEGDADLGSVPEIRRISVAGIEEDGSPSPKRFCKEVVGQHIDVKSAVEDAAKAAVHAAALYASGPDQGYAQPAVYIGGEGADFSGSDLDI